MASKKLEAEMEVLKEKDQSPYFYSKLKEIRERKEKRKNRRNPMRRFRKRLSVAKAFDDDDDETESSSEDSENFTEDKAPATISIPFWGVGE